MRETTSFVLFALCGLASCGQLALAQVNTAYVVSLLRLSHQRGHLYATPPTRSCYANSGRGTTNWRCRVRRPLQ